MKKNKYERDLRRALKDAAIIASVDIESPYLKNSDTERLIDEVVWLVDELRKETEKLRAMRDAYVALIEKLYK